MFRIVFPSVAMTILVAAVAGYFAGTRGALSAVIGAGACFVPSLLFSLYVKYASRHQGAFMLAKFFLGELLKIVVSIALLACAMKFYEPHWIALFAGMVLGVALALQASFFVIRDRS